MRTLSGVLTIVLVAGAIVACGGAGNGTTASERTRASAGSAPGDFDEDDSRHPRIDNDKLTNRSYGHEAHGAGRLAVVALVKRYFAGAAAGDGRQGCMLLDSTMARAAPMDYGVYGPVYLRGARTCAAVLSRLFEHEHRHLAMTVKRLKVKSVRVEGNTGFAILNIGGTHERQMDVGRERGRWMVQAPLDKKVRKIE